MPRISKADLATQYADKFGVTKSAAADAVNGLVDLIATNLRSGTEVSLMGFGTFGLKHSDARVGRNPATGAPVHIGAKTSVKFKPAKDLI